MERKVHPETQDVYGKTVQSKLVVHKEVFVWFTEYLRRVKLQQQCWSNVKLSLEFVGIEYLQRICIG